MFIHLLFLYNFLTLKLLIFCIFISSFQFLLPTFYTIYCTFAIVLGNKFNVKILFSIFLYLSSTGLKYMIVTVNIITLTGSKITMCTIIFLLLTSLYKKYVGKTTFFFAIFLHKIIPFTLVIYFYITFLFSFFIK